VIYTQPGKWEVTEVELDPPREGEVLIRMGAAGLCHSDDHIATGDLPLPYLPACAGHEGAGVVEAVGEGVSRFAPGDHVVTTFIPSCGHCRWCAKGMQALCDNGALLFSGRQLDGTFRMHAGATDVGQVAMISTFSEYSVVPEQSTVKISKDVPFTSACLLGCCVPTGWGSAVNVAQVAPGDAVIVVGLGGVGTNALQGCRHASATHVLAVDTDEKKLHPAMSFGATESFSSLADAAERGRELTNGQGADAVIITVGINSGALIGEALNAVRKAGTVVATATGDARTEDAIPVNVVALPMYQKRIQGTIYGGCSPAVAIPVFVEMYHNGQLLLDELVTQTYPLSEINQAYEDMHEGRNIRGVVDFSRAGLSK
jgi:S-(hydroxymethyl)glutathione dehydrogenase/alcohol dehydrogenase